MPISYVKNEDVDTGTIIVEWNGLTLDPNAPGGAQDLGQSFHCRGLVLKAIQATGFNSSFATTVLEGCVGNIAQDFVGLPGGVNNGFVGAGIITNVDLNLNFVRPRAISGGFGLVNVAAMFKRS